MSRKISHSLVSGRAGAGTGGQGLKIGSKGRLYWKDVDEESLIPLVWYGDRGLIAGSWSDAVLGIDLSPLVAPMEESFSQEQEDAKNPLCPAAAVIRICHNSSSTNIEEHWPLVYMSLKKLALDYKEMILMAIATVYVETGRFAPLDEYISRYNTSPNGHPFDKYDCNFLHIIPL